MSDGTATLRDYWAASVQHRNPFDFTHDALEGAPQGSGRVPAALLANGAMQAAFVWGLGRITGNVIAWNAFMVLGLVGTGLAMFALLDRLGCTWIASIFGAFVFAFSPFDLERAYAGQLGLLENWTLVLTLGALLRFRSRRTALGAIPVGLAIALAFYNSAYAGLLAAVIAFAFFLAELARLPRARERVRSLGLAAVAYASSVIALAPVLVLFSLERTAVDQAAGHETSDFYTFAARMSAYVVPSPTNPLFHWVRRFHPADLTEQSLFFGYTTAFLAIAAVVMMIRRNAWFVASQQRLWAGISMALLAPIAFTMSLPPLYRVGHTYIITGSTALALLTTFWRDYSRIGLLVGLALATLAAMALSALAQREGRFWRVLPTIALALVVVELLPGNVGAFRTNVRPQWVAWLASAPRGIEATYPIDYPAGPGITLSNAEYWYQVFDRDPMFAFAQPSSLEEGTREFAIRLRAADLELPLTAKILATEGVRYVVVHDDVYRAEGQPAPRLDPTQYTLLARFGPVRIFGVHASHTSIASLLAHPGACRVNGVEAHCA